jgi:choline transport protein
LQNSSTDKDAGWVTIIGWQAGQASVAFLAAEMIQALAILNYPNYSPTRWQGTLIFYGVIAFIVFINTYLARWLPKIEGMILILHIVGFFAILIPLVYLAPHGSARDVFATFINGGGWNTNGLSFFVGLITSVFSFLGMYRNHLKMVPLLTFFEGLIVLVTCVSLAAFTGYRKLTVL